MESTREKRTTSGRFQKILEALFNQWPLVCLLAILLGAMTACQTIEATGERHLSFIGEQQEIEMGEASNEDIVRTMGLYPDESLQRYVQELGMSMARTTERPELPWTFQVVDDDVVNAFALPGGYIYLTRGIMAHFENEAQLVGVLGHEIAHVTAKHAVIRVSKAMITQLGFGVATIAVPELQSFSSILGQGMQLLFLKFSRDDETEADELGIRYMLNVNENPKELMDVMAMLARISEGGEKGTIPEWASTHPYPENRMEFIGARLAELGPRDFAPVERESYLRRLEGMTYGSDPREGFVRESMFYHPALAFQLEFPQGWKVVNRRSTVVGLSPGQNAAFQLSVGQQRDPQEALQAFLGQSGIQGRSSSASQLHGLPAANGEFLAQTKQGAVQGQATFVLHNRRLFQLFGYTPQRFWNQYGSAIQDTAQSFRRSADENILNAEPLRLKIVRTDAAVPLRELHARHRVAIPLEELARLNQVAAEEAIEAGKSVKLVIGKTM